MVPPQGPRDNNYELVIPKPMAPVVRPTHKRCHFHNALSNKPIIRIRTWYGIQFPATPSPSAKKTQLPHKRTLQIKITISQVRTTSSWTTVIANLKASPPTNLTQYVLFCRRQYGQPIPRKPGSSNLGAECSPFCVRKKIIPNICDIPLSHSIVGCNGLFGDFSSVISGHSDRQEGG